MDECGMVGNWAITKAFEDGVNLQKHKMLEKAREWFTKNLYIHTEENEDKHWGKISHNFNLI